MRGSMSFVSRIFSSFCNKFIFKEPVKIKGLLKIKIHDAITGEIIQEIQQNNLVVTIGRNLLRDFMRGTVTVGIQQFAIGTNSTAVTISDSQLGTEVFRSGTITYTASAETLQVEMYVTSAQANGSTIVEAGLFCDSTATSTVNTGKLYSRAVHSSIVKTSSIAITYVWVLTWTQ